MRVGNVDTEKVTKELMRAERDILSWQRVRVARHGKMKKDPVAIRSSCGETHPAADGDLCTMCSSKETCYEVTE